MTGSGPGSTILGDIYCDCCTLYHASCGEPVPFALSTHLPLPRIPRRQRAGRASSPTANPVFRSAPTVLSPSTLTPHAILPARHSREGQKNGLSAKSSPSLLSSSTQHLAPSTLTTSSAPKQHNEGRRGLQHWPQRQNKLTQSLLLARPSPARVIHAAARSL